MSGHSVGGLNAEGLTLHSAVHLEKEGSGPKSRTTKESWRPLSVAEREVFIRQVDPPPYAVGGSS